MASSSPRLPARGPYPPHQDLPPFTREKLAGHYASLARLLPPEYRQQPVGIINSATADYLCVMRHVRLVDRWLQLLIHNAGDGRPVDLAQLRRQLMIEDAGRRYRRGDWVDHRRRGIFKLCFGDAPKLT